jgi:hypothetical protein
MQLSSSWQGDFLMRRTTRKRAARTAIKTVELAIAAPQVIGMRTAQALTAGAVPSNDDRAEFLRMGAEKVDAYWEGVFAVGMQLSRIGQEYARNAALQWMRLWMTPWWLTGSWPNPFLSYLRAASRISVPSVAQQQSAATRITQAALAPVHKRATANMRRLARKASR